MDYNWKELGELTPKKLRQPSKPYCHGYCRNFKLPAGTGSAKLLKAVDEVQ
jgi:hypothetical protein